MTAMTAMVPSKPPEHEFRLGPSPSSFVSTSDTNDYQSPSKVPVDFSPPLIAMVVVVATAFLIVTYSRLISRHLLPPFLRLLRSWRRWHRRRRRRRSHMPSSAGDIESPPYNGSFDATEAYQVFSPYGLDESVIKTIPLSLYTAKGLSKHGFVDDSRDCAVCLLEFEDNDCVRVLPVCSHAFHVDCIDIWLRSHANCPLCRAGIFRHESPFIPVMAARIRPSLDDAILESILLEPLSEAAPESETTVTEIVPAEPSPRRNQSEDRFNARDFMLKRSYSFGFERNFPSERLVMEPATASPWRYRRGSFWSKRPSPFGSLTKSRVFSFRYYRGMKSPFFRRRGSFFPLSESHARFSGGGSSRRTKSLTSPIFIRSSATASASTRLRCRDLEALLSPERFNRR